MTEIPLHALRRNKTKAGYIALESSTPTHSPDMPTAVRAAAATSKPSRARRAVVGDGRQQSRYTDDPEEASRLLEEEEGSEGWSAPERTVPPPSPRSLLSRKSKKAGKDKSRTVPFRPPGVCVQFQ